MTEKTKRYMKNTKTGAKFPFDEVQVADEKKPYMQECDAEGNLVFPGGDGPSREQVLSRRVAELEAKVNEQGAADADTTVLQQENSELRAEFDKLAAEKEELVKKLEAAGQPADEGFLQTRVNALTARVAELEAAITEQGGELPAVVTPETECPETFSADDVEALKSEARELDIRGFTKMPPAELWAKVQAKKAKAE